MSASEAEKDQERALLEQRQLLPRHVGGEESAFREFMNIYRTAVFSYIVRLGVQGAARDCTGSA